MTNGNPKAGSQSLKFRDRASWLCRRRSYLLAVAVTNIVHRLLHFSALWLLHAFSTRTFVIFLVEIPLNFLRHSHRTDSRHPRPLSYWNPVRVDPPSTRTKGVFRVGYKVTSLDSGSVIQQCFVSLSQVMIEKISVKTFRLSLIHMCFNPFSIK